MKIVHYVAVTVILVAILLNGCTQKSEEDDVIFQVSSIDALMAGIYDQQLLFEDLIKHGEVL